MTTLSLSNFLDKFQKRNKQELAVEFAGQLGWFHYGIVGLVAVLVLALAAMAGVLSFEAMEDLATKWKISSPSLIPLVVDGAVVAGLLYILYVTLMRIGGKWLGWVLVIVGDLISVWFNLTHGGYEFGQPFQTSHLMAVVPPIFLLVTFEVLTRMLHYLLERLNTVTAFVEMVKRYYAAKDEIEARLLTLRHEEKSLSDNVLSLESYREQAEILKIETEAKRKQAEAEAEEYRLTLLAQVEAEAETQRVTLLQAVEGQAEEQRQELLSEAEVLSAKKATLQAEVESLKAVVAGGVTTQLSDKQERQIIVRFLWSHQRETGISTQKQLADLVGVSSKTVSADLADLGVKS